MEPSTKLKLEIERGHQAWDRLEGFESRLRKTLRVLLASLPRALRCAGGATLLLTGDKEIRALNRKFRRKDKPTNVLSFPQFAPEDLKSAIRKQRSASGKLSNDRCEQLYLGDIAMSWQTAQAEADRDGKTVIDHATHLVIHGTLHLFGYDHMREAEADRMEALEIEIMKKLGLKNPYLDPASPVDGSAQAKHARK